MTTHIRQPCRAKQDDEPFPEEPTEAEVNKLSEGLADLDEESKSMLFLLCLSSFNELQNKFFHHYDRLLHLRKKMLKVTPEESKLYSALYKSQKNFMNTPIQDDGHETESVEEEFHEEIPPSQPQPRPPESSMLRTLWRRYRIEFFIKAMLLIFLLKLPYVCYIITTVVFVLYCLGFFRVVVRLSRTLRRSRNVQTLTRFLVNILDTLEPLLLVPVLQDPIVNPRQPRAPNVATPGAGQTQPQRPTTVPATETLDINEILREIMEASLPEQVQNAIREQLESEQEPQPQQESATASPDQEQPSAETQAAEPTPEEAPEQQPAQEQPAPEQPTATEQPAQSAEPPRSGQPSQASSARRQPRQKPSYIEKVIYQVFFSFVLSLLPWWEPNPIYLEE